MSCPSQVKLAIYYFHGSNRSVLSVNVEKYNSNPQIQRWVNHLLALTIMVRNGHPVLKKVLPSFGALLEKGRELNLHLKGMDFPLTQLLTID